MIMNEIKQRDESIKPLTEELSHDNTHLTEVWIFS